ncbi:MAG: T9SS type A sorting domain-containing protein [Ferruginibacter sp.]
MKKPSIPLLLLLALSVSFRGICLPVLNSLPTAAATIYLDFDGYNVNSAYWNGGTPFTCVSSGMTDIQIKEVYDRVAEDYRPFDINITTDELKFLAAPLSSRIRVVITSTSNWFTGVGGVSFVGSFKWGDDTPAFVFSDRLGSGNPKIVAECCSHESGHAVGLSHQSTYDSTCNLTATYNEGEGTGEASWAPIMGNSYYRNMSGWNNGPTPYGCATTQDNLSIITTQNGFTYRTDDYSDDIKNNAANILFSGVDVSGIISTNTDKDAFTFTLTQNSAIHLDIRPFSVDANYEGANLDVKMSLYNSAGILVQNFDPAATMNVVADTILNKGTYYILIDGAGNSNVDDYGSLGSYTISSSVTAIFPERSVALKGAVEKDKHDLNWDIISDEHIRSVILESSVDGIQFNTVNGITASNSFTYTPFQKNDLYYRVKVISVSNNIIYSNTIKLKGVSKSGKLFIVSTLIQNWITVNAGDNYQYLVSDINGNAIARGKGEPGLNKLDMSRMPGGMYVLQLFSNNQHQTERIVKQ